MRINPGFLGDTGLDGHFSRRRNWFYSGFKTGCKLSKRRILSCGQKLPKDWEKKAENIVGCIVRDQMPQHRPDRTFKSGAKVTYVLNSDQPHQYSVGGAEKTTGTVMSILVGKILVGKRRTGSKSN